MALAIAAAERRRPALILDLAPKATDLASRFGAANEEGFAELVDGERQLWEIVHRQGTGRAFYLPCGLRTPGAELARAPAARTLADRVRGEGRILLVPLDRRGAGEAASAGWVDGFVRLGDRSVSSARLSGDVEQTVPSAAAPGGSAADSTASGRRTVPADFGDSASSTPEPASDSGDARPR